jgi:hypothetical protein
VAGNLLRGVETADWAALEGRAAARSVARYLQTAEWNGSRLEVRCEAPLAWVCPNVLSPDVPVERFRFRSGEFRQNARLKVSQGGRVLFQKRLGRLPGCQYFPEPERQMDGEGGFRRRTHPTCRRTVSHGKVGNGSCPFLCRDSSISLWSDHANRTCHRFDHFDHQG